MLISATNRFPCLLRLLISRLSLKSKLRISSFASTFSNPFAFQRKPQCPLSTMAFFGGIHESIVNSMEVIDLCTLETEDQECYICYRSLPSPSKTQSTTPEEQEDLAVRMKVCGHVFGKACITEWLQFSSTCPQCRREVFKLPTMNLPSIYLPIWREDRARCLEDMERLLGDPASTTAIVQRAIDFVLRETSNDARPPYETRLLGFSLAGNIKELARGGWIEYIQWFEDKISSAENSLDELVGWGRRIRWQRRADADETLRQCKIWRGEVESCRNALGWQALSMMRKEPTLDPWYYYTEERNSVGMSE